MTPRKIQLIGFISTCFLLFAFVGLSSFEVRKVTTNPPQTVHIPEQSDLHPVLDVNKPNTALSTTWAVCHCGDNTTEPTLNTPITTVHNSQMHYANVGSLWQAHGMSSDEKTCDGDFGFGLVERWRNARKVYCRPGHSEIISHRVHQSRHSGPDNVIEVSSKVGSSCV